MAAEYYRYKLESSQFDTRRARTRGARGRL